jgi:hypothetical protein
MIIKKKNDGCTSETPLQHWNLDKPCLKPWEATLEPGSTTQYRAPWNSATLG